MLRAGGTLRLAPPPLTGAAVETGAVTEAEADVAAVAVNEVAAARGELYMVLCSAFVKVPGSGVSTLRCDGVVNAGLALLGRGLNQLYDLDLSGCKDLSDAGLQAAFGYPHYFRILEHLALRNCSQISDAGLAYLGNLYLKALDLTNLDKITDEGLMKLSGTALRELKVDGCTQLTAQGMCRFWVRRVEGFRDDD